MPEIVRSREKALQQSPQFGEMVWIADAAVESEDFRDHPLVQEFRYLFQFVFGVFCISERTLDLVNSRSCFRRIIW